MEQTIDLKEALKAGRNPQEMIDEFTRQLVAAQEEVEEEKKAKLREDRRLNEAREELVYSAIEYLVALGLMSEDVLDDEKKIVEVTEILKDSEKDIQEVKALIDSIEKIHKTPKAPEKKAKTLPMPNLTEEDMDRMLRAFVKTL